MSLARFTRVLELVALPLQLQVAGALLLALEHSACSRQSSEPQPAALEPPGPAPAAPRPIAQPRPTPEPAPAVAPPAAQAELPAAPAPAPTAVSAARKPRVRTLHPQPGANECVEMYGSCTPEPDSVCTTEAFVLPCGERGKHPRSGAPLRCACP